MSIYRIGEHIYIQNGKAKSFDASKPSSEVSKEDLELIYQDEMYDRIEKAIEEYIKAIGEEEISYYAEILGDEDKYGRMIDAAEKMLEEFIEVNMQMVIMKSINDVIVKNSEEISGT